MGTNFYHVKDGKPACECCKRPYETKRRHIGKSSVGWMFALHIIPEDGITSLGDWTTEWLKRDTHIEDEYGGTLTPQEMLSRILNRPADNLRHDINRQFTGRGHGTYDFIVGEFS